jgi:hypothetical protein
MNYKNYTEAIVKNALHKLVGWPESVPFCKPGSIGAVTDLREIWSAIQSKQIFFRKITEEEAADLRCRTNQDDQEEANNDDGDADRQVINTGNLLKRKRKERSDKGKARGPKKRVVVADENNENLNNAAGVGDDVNNSQIRKRKHTGVSSSRGGKRVRME